MDIVVLARMCLRRWYVFLVVVVLAVAFAVVNYTSARPVYTASAQLIVVATSRSADTAAPAVTPSTSPSSSNSPKPTPTGTGAPNPLQNVQTTIVALVARMQSQQGAVQVGSDTATFTVAQVKKGGPLLTVLGTGTGSAAVQQALAAGIPATSSALVALQDDVGAPAESRFRVVTLNVDRTAAREFPSRTKGLVVTIAVGLLVAVLLATTTDAIVGRPRQRPRRDEPAPAP